MGADTDRRVGGRPRGCIRGTLVVARSGYQPGAAPPAGAAGSSPLPRRLRAPRWVNVRLIGGLLLILISVIVGARVITAADTADTVWAAAADLAAGTVLAEADLRTVSVRLAGSADAYLLSSADPIGLVLNTPIRAGELLPRSVVADSSPLVDIALPIAAGYVPPSLHRGQLVDVYALDLTPNAPPAQVDPAAQPPQNSGSDIVTLVVRAAVVQLIAGRTDGALSIGSSTVQVVISVEAAEAADIFAETAGMVLALAVRAFAARPSYWVYPGAGGGAGDRVPTSPTPPIPTG